MYKIRWFEISLSAILFLSPAAFGQTPLGPEILPASGTGDHSTQAGAVVACDAQSVCALIWPSFDPDPELPVNNAKLWGRTIAPSGALSPLRLLRQDEGLDVFNPVVATKRGFSVFSQRGFQTGILGYWRFSETLTQEGKFVRQPFHAPARYGDERSIGSTGVIVGTPRGYAEIGLAFDRPETPCAEGSCFGVFLYLFDAAGHKLRGRVRVNQESRFLETANTGCLTLNGEGNLIAAFTRIHQRDAIDARGEIFVRQFSSAGEPRTGEVPVGANLGGFRSHPAVAAGADGQFLVVWEQRPDRNSDFGVIYGQRFDARSRALGDEFLVSSDLPAQAAPQVIADHNGNYFVAWNSYEAGHEDVRGRLFQDGGIPAGPDFRINEESPFDQGLTSAAFAPNGTLIVGYGSNDPTQTKGQLNVPVVRRFAVPKAQSQ